MRAFVFVALMLAACTSPAGGGTAPDTARLPEHIRMDLAQRDAALRAPGVVAAGIGQTADLGNGLRVRVNVEGVGEREVILDEAAVETPRGAFTMVAASPGPWTDWPEEQRPPYRFGFRRG